MNPVVLVIALFVIHNAYLNVYLWVSVVINVYMSIYNIHHTASYMYV